MTLGHGLSAPANPAAAAIPDGLSLGGIPGLVALSIGPGYTYGGPSFVFPMPGSTFAHGDFVRIQFLAPDPAYPGGVGASNEVGFAYSDCQGNTASPSVGPHARVEARGVGSIQVSGFFEVHNTGNDPIVQVIIDLSTATGAGAAPMTAFNPGGALNSGGTLMAGTSYRRNTEVLTGLDFANAGNTLGGYTEFMGTGPNGGGVAGMPSGLQFDFISGGPAFDACIDKFLFDCDTQDAAAAGNKNGEDAIGATVMVTFANGTVLMGTMVADPNDPNAAIIDL